MRTRAMNRLFAATLAAICLSLCGCVDTGAHIVPSVTLAPEPTPTPVPTPEPTPTPEPSPTPALPEMADLDVAYDALGEYITSADHYQRYITFRNIQVYEQHEDTFMDAIAVNEYPDTLVCAVEIAFFDEEGEPIAYSRAQTRDGQYVLRLQPGDNTIFAQIDTDMRLTDKEFTLGFSPELSVLPQ